MMAGHEWFAGVEDEEMMVSYVTRDADEDPKSNRSMISSTGKMLTHLVRRSRHHVLLQIH